MTNLRKDGVVRAPSYGGVLRTSWVCLLVAAWAIYGSDAYADAHKNHRDALFGRMAENLSKEIITAYGPPTPTPTHVDRIERAIRVAIWPFDEADVPVNLALASELNARLLQKLLAGQKRQLEFVVRREMSALIADIHKHDLWGETDGNPVAALMRTASDIDVLIVGGMRLDGDAVYLRYQAIDRSGLVLAQTRPGRLELTPEEIGGYAVQTLDQAIKAAARKLWDDAPNISTVILSGIQFQASGTQPPLGRYLGGRISTALQDIANDQVTGRGLVVRPLDSSLVTIRVLSNKRGRASARSLTKTGRLEPFISKEGEPVHLLSGSYWEFKRTVEIRFEVRDHNGQTASWRGRVRKESLGNLAARPTSKLRWKRKAPSYGPVALRLTSARGDSPVYRIGEKLNLLLRVDRQAWLYCFYEQADGKTVQFFPNPNFLRRHRSPKLDGGRIIVFPGERGFPFNLRLTKPAGYERIRCFAADRDIQDRLPTVLRGTRIEPIPKAVAADLATPFTSLRDVSITEAQLPVTVIRGEP